MTHTHTRTYTIRSQHIFRFFAKAWASNLNIYEPGRRDSVRYEVRPTGKRIWRWMVVDWGG